ncbi:MAG: DsbA family protein [Gemmatimonadetes bacterium]|nr:DsbA family protein [Gemmatimonadota bacterium]MBI3569403.1 DsbA family protein [Gemmatimonadota bacterium]
MRRLLILPLAALLAACTRGDAASNQPAPPRNPAELHLAEATIAKSDSLIGVADRGRILGAESATTWLVIVSDFQCPYCKMWHDESFAAIKKDYVDTGKLRVAYLNFPLPMHQNAMPAANYAMCASAQGKFWETEEKIFTSQGAWEKLSDPRAYFDSLSATAGVDVAKLRACIRTDAMKPLIDADLERGRQAGVQSTPTFFVAQRQLLGAQPLREFRRVIDSVLAAAPKKG